MDLQFANLLSVSDILGLLGGGGGACRGRGWQQKLQDSAVYLYLKRNLPRLINDYDERSDSVPGDGEMKKRLRATRFIWTWAWGGSRVSGRDGAGGGIPVCSVQGRGAD